MTSVTIEQFHAPSSARSARRLEGAERRAAEGLAGRTVWCATALPAGHAPARALRDCLLAAAESGVSASTLEVESLDPIRALAQRLSTMLEGAQGQLGPADAEVYDDASCKGESLVGGGVHADDVVVLYDPFTAVLADAIRERGAHVVWRIDVAAPGSGEAWAFLRRYTSAVDAYLTTWPTPERGVSIQRIAALMPSPDAVATTDVAPGPAAERRHDLGWRSVLAATVAADRAETVGGTRHPRPGVAAR
jgi:hypothetical protein